MRACSGIIHWPGLGKFRKGLFEEVTLEWRSKGLKKKTEERRKGNRGNILGKGVLSEGTLWAWWIESSRPLRLGYRLQGEGTTLWSTKTRLSRTHWPYWKPSLFLENKVGRGFDLIRSVFWKVHFSCSVRIWTGPALDQLELIGGC